MEQEITNQERKQQSKYGADFQSWAQDFVTWNHNPYSQIVSVLTFVDRNKTKEQREYMEKLKSSAQDVEFEEV